MSARTTSAASASSKIRTMNWTLLRLYHSVTTENSSIRLHNGKAKYALYPVWLLNTTWKGKKYLFAMNGQTGKFVGDLPVDNGLYFKWLGGLTAGFGVIALIAYFLFWLF